MLVAARNPEGLDSLGRQASALVLLQAHLAPGCFPHLRQAQPLTCTLRKALGAFGLLAPVTQLFNRCAVGVGKRVVRLDAQAALFLVAEHVVRVGQAGMAATVAEVGPVAQKVATAVKATPSLSSSQRSKTCELKSSKTARSRT